MSTTDAVMSSDQMKRNAAHAALEFLHAGELIGVGSGTTVWAFVDEIGASGLAIPAAVAASDETSRKLRELGIEVVELGEHHPAVYVDGADEIDMSGCAIKGGGAAHTREKAIAMASDHWVCVVDAGKVVPTLGGVPVPLEVSPNAVDAVRDAIARMGGQATVRTGVLTDAGNPVLDAHGLSLADAVALEGQLDAIPGVIGNGVFAKRPADVILIGRSSGGVSRVVPRRVEEFGV